MERFLKFEIGYEVIIPPSRIAKETSQRIEQMRHSQWIGHILKRLHLLDAVCRKRGMDGMIYAIQSDEGIDMMRHYDVAVIQEPG